MTWLVTAGLIAVALRLAYPAALERRAARRFPVAPNGIIRGAEPITLVHKNAPGVLLLHGGGDTPQVVEGLARHLHASGYTVRVPLLAAHGRSLAALRKASADEWLAQCHQELDDVRGASPRFYLVGLSVGGAICVHLAADDDDVAAMVLLAPYLEMPPYAVRAARWANMVGWLIPYVSSMGSHSIRDRAAARRALGFGLLTPALLRSFHAIVAGASERLPRVTAPTLVIHSRADNRTPEAAARRAFARLGSSEKRLEFVDGGAHVITVDFGYERVFQLTQEWLDAHGH